MMASAVGARLGAGIGPPPPPELVFFFMVIVRFCDQRLSLVRVSIALTLIW